MPTSSSAESLALVATVPVTYTGDVTQLDLTARFQTGPLTHNLVMGFETARETVNLGRFNNPFNRNNNWIPETPLLAPPVPFSVIEPPPLVLSVPFMSEIP